MSEPIGVVVISHGTLAEGLVAASTMILGESENLIPLCFTEDVDPDEFGEKISETVTSFSSGCIVLCDLTGGTPFNQLLLATPFDTYKAVAGVNLNMLMEVLSERDDCTVDELVQTAIEAGNAGIVDVSELMAKRLNNSK